MGDIHNVVLNNAYSMQVGLYQLDTYSVDVVAQLLCTYLAQAVALKFSMLVQPCQLQNLDETWCHMPFALVPLPRVLALLATIRSLDAILE